MQPLSLHHLHLPGTFGTSLRYFANVAITAQCPFGCFPTRVGIFTAILGCAVLRLEKRCFAFAAADFGCLQLGLVGTFATGILVLTVGPPTNLTLVAERCLVLGALVLGLLALLELGCGALRKELLVELYLLINPKGIDQLTFLEFTLDVVEYGYWIC